MYNIDYPVAGKKRLQARTNKKGGGGEKRSAACQKERGLDLMATHQSPYWGKARENLGDCREKVKSERKSTSSTKVRPQRFAQWGGAFFVVSTEDR